MKKLKIAYFGTPYFSARFLEKLLTDTTINRLIEVKLVVTQPDKSVGKKQILTKSSVKMVAEKYKLPLLDSLRSLEEYCSSEIEKKLKKIDLALIYYYGQIIPKKMLIVPKFGFWNIHFSLLSKLRGATPATFSLILGDKKTAVSLVQTDEKLDHGDLVAQEEVKINPDETRIELEERLQYLAYKIFVDQIDNLLKNKIKLTPQNHAQATFTRLLTKDDGFIPLSILKKAINNQQLTIDDSPKIIKDYYQKNNLSMKQFNNETIYNLFRGLYPWPGIWTTIKIKNQEKRLKIANLIINNQQLTIKSVQLEGKKEVDFETFNRAYSIF